MEDLKKKINFDSSLLYYSPSNKEKEEDEKSSVTNVETYNSTNRKHVCTICGKRFFSSNSLSTHMKHHSPNERPNAEIDNDNVDLNRKNQYIWNKGIKCNKLECNFIALDAVEYSKHISSCEGTRMNKNSENVTFCEPCDSYFSSENHFKAHLILQHPDSDPEISLKEYDDKQTTVLDPISLYSENNLENEENIKMKNVSHSKYSESFISKKKSKEMDEKVGNITTDKEKNLHVNESNVKIISEPILLNGENSKENLAEKISDSASNPASESDHQIGGDKNSIFTENSDHMKAELIKSPNSNLPSQSNLEESNENIKKLERNSDSEHTKADNQEQENQSLEITLSNTDAVQNLKLDFQNSMQSAGKIQSSNDKSHSEDFHQQVKNVDTVNSVNDEDLSNLQKDQEKTEEENTQQIKLSEEFEKEDSDFDDFDYSRAGKKKYSKLSNRLNENQEVIDSNKNSIENRSFPVIPKTEPYDEKLLDSNVKERSIRNRKKLILPDYEYDSDYKGYCGKEAPQKRMSLSKNGDTTPKKRGRPRKNPISITEDSDLSSGLSSMDVSTAYNHSDSKIKSDVEISQFDKTEDSTEIISLEDSKESTDMKFKETSLENIDISLSSAQDDTMQSDDEFKIELEEIEVPIPPVTKKKRGRPPKPKEEKSVKPHRESAVDKESEESIFSDLANALLSLGSAITHKPQETTSNHTISQSIDSIESPPIKKKKGRPPKPKTEINIEKKLPQTVNEPHVEVKNKFNNETSVGSCNVSDLNSEPSKPEKGIVHELSEEARMNSFMNDLSLMANVSTPKKRGRPRKIMKKQNVYAKKSHLELLSSAAYYKQRLHKVSHLKDIRNNPNKLLKPKIMGQIEEPAKKKIRSNKIKSHLDAESFSLLQNNTLAKKRGRPPLKIKTLEDESKKETPAEKSMDIEEQEDIVVRYIQTQHEDSFTDISNNSKVMEEVKSEEIIVPKRKKGRPRKIKPEEDPDTVTASDTFSKDPVDDEWKPSSRGQVRRTSVREDSDFIYESYHPKKKRDRSYKSFSENESTKSEKDETETPECVAKPKKPRSTPTEHHDETYKINQDLVIRDNKSRVKYGKLFKRAKYPKNNDSYKDDSLITCGRCKEKMTFRHYKLSHQIYHYFLCWIEGEPEIDLSDDKEITKILQAAITPDSLRKKIIRLGCEKCGDVRKSVVGYVSHVRFCQKEDSDDLYETCKLCGRNLRPSSVRFHYIKFHGCYNYKTKNQSNLSTRKDNSEEMDQEDSDEDKPRTSKLFRMGFSRTYLDKNSILEDEDFWTNLKTSYDLYMCMGLSCKHMTVSKDDLKVHITNCCRNFCEFTCTSCEFRTKYENEIIYHTKRNCRENSDMEEKDEKIPERRISTRRKKRKFIYDNSDLNGSSEEKKSGDDEFEASDTSESEDDDSDTSVHIANVTTKRHKVKRKNFEKSVVMDKCGLRQAFQQYCVGKTDPLSWTVELRIKLFSASPLHLHMKVSKEWETSLSSEIDKHCPIHNKSMKIYFDNVPSSQFSLFQADVIKGVPICFVGGPVWAMAWAPLPANVTEQYLAVSTLQHMNHLVEINSSVIFPSLIQFWKYSSIDNISNDIHKPTLSLAIAHNYGAVWAMEWCPSGGFNLLLPTCRLGILAAATSSGCVIVYNVPKFEPNNEILIDQKEIILNPKPDLILKIRNEDVQCTRIAWDLNAPHNTIIGGFSDGTVAFWNINTASVLLRKGNVIYPYRTFEAHNSPITALDLHWIDNSRFLLTGSTDRVTRYWDLNDLSGPLYESERTTPTTNAIWMQHWIVTANTHDFGALVGESSAFLAHPRDSLEKRKTLLNIRDAFWSVSYSLWNDMVAAASNGGHVSVFSAKHLSLLTFKNHENKVITTTSLVDLNDDEKKELDVKGVCSEMPSIDDLFDCTSVVQSQGIRFCDRTKTKTNSEVLNFDMDKCSSPSVNKVCWNQNYNSFNWLAIGYECGFVRVIRVERFEKHYLTKFYKTNENNATLM